MMAVDEFRDVMLSRDLTARQVAAATGYSARSIAAYWYGEHPVNPDVESFLRTGVPRQRDPRRPFGRRWADDASRSRRGIDVVSADLARAEERAARQARAIARMCEWCDSDQHKCWEPKCPLRPWWGGGS